MGEFELFIGGILTGGTFALITTYAIHRCTRELTEPSLRTSKAGQRLERLVHRLWNKTRKLTLPVARKTQRIQHNVYGDAIVVRVQDVTMEYLTPTPDISDPDAPEIVYLCQTPQRGNFWLYVPEPIYGVGTCGAGTVLSGVFRPTGTELTDPQGNTFPVLTPDCVDLIPGDVAIYMRNRFIGGWHKQYSPLETDIEKKSAKGKP